MRTSKKVRLDANAARYFSELNAIISLIVDGFISPEMFTTPENSAVSGTEVF
jgi:hypothetical protein